MKTLGEQFQDSMGQPVNLDGKSVLPIFSEFVSKEVLVSLRWIGTRSSVKQGVKIKLDKGTIEVNGQKLSDIVLWEDTCPSDISLRCIPKKTTKLKIWNVWEVDGLVQAWVGNAGIIISRDNDKLTMLCSDGVGDVDFKNLELEVQLSN